jgi:hypothetical protein
VFFVVCFNSGEREGDKWKVDRTVLSNESGYLHLRRARAPIKFKLLYLVSLGETLYAGKWVLSQFPN